MNGYDGRRRKDASHIIYLSTLIHTCSPHLHLHLQLHVPIPILSTNQTTHIEFNHWLTRSLSLTHSHKKPTKPDQIIVSNHSFDVAMLGHAILCHATLCNTVRHTAGLSFLSSPVQPLSQSLSLIATNQAKLSLLSWELDKTKTNKKRPTLSASRWPSRLSQTGQI